MLAFVGPVAILASSAIFAPVTADNETGLAGVIGSAYDEVLSILPPDAEDDGVIVHEASSRPLKKVDVKKHLPLLVGGGLLLLLACLMIWKRSQVGAFLKNIFTHKYSVEDAKQALQDLWIEFKVAGKEYKQIKDSFIATPPHIPEYLDALDSLKRLHKTLIKLEVDDPLFKSLSADVEDTSHTLLEQCQQAETKLNEVEESITAQSIENTRKLIEDAVQAAKARLEEHKGETEAEGKMVEQSERLRLLLKNVESRLAKVSSINKIVGEIRSAVQVSLGGGEIQTI